ncbi:MAG: hypothetical protein JNM18_18980 [Planctomycetaceae bacterium]|nr:hypothetical protein [Planctomycetaceae bacterium]
MRLRHRTTSPPPGGYFFQRDHKRAASLVLLLGLMTILFGFVGKPESAQWFMMLVAPQNQGPIDSRLPKQAGAVDGQAVLVAQADDQPAAAAPVADDSGPKPRLPGITDELLAPIRDDGVFSSSEVEPYYQLFKLVRDTAPAELAKHAESDVPYSQLFAQPKSYRGRVVHQRGIIRAVFADLKLGPNPAGLEKYHTLWISPIDRAKREIYFVRCLELPDDLPRGEAPKNEPFGEVEFTGVYYKRLAYQARDDVRSTPLVLAKNVTWRKIEPVVADAVVVAQQDHTAGWITAVGIALAVMVVALWYITRKPAPDPVMARQMAFSTGRRLANRKPLDDLRDLEVSPDVLAALDRATDESTPPGQV